MHQRLPRLHLSFCTWISVTSNTEIKYRQWDIIVKYVDWCHLAASVASSQSTFVARCFDMKKTYDLALFSPSESNDNFLPQRRASERQCIWNDGSGQIKNDGEAMAVMEYDTGTTVYEGHVFEQVFFDRRLTRAESRPYLARTFPSCSSY